MKPRNKKGVVILGAGLSGLSAAWHLQKDGKGCRIFEKESEPGGLCRSKTVKGFTPLEISRNSKKGAGFLTGFTFDYSGHLLHFKNKSSLNLIKGLLGDNLLCHRRNAWVYSFDTYTRYPFQFHLHGLPRRVIKECLEGFINRSQVEVLHRKKDLSFLDWINLKLGSGIARHFMIPYNRKFWQVSPSELTADWTENFVPIPSFRELISGSIADNSNGVGYNSEFWYPKKNGIQELIRSFSGRVNNLHTAYEAVRMDLGRKRVYFKNGFSESYEKLIFTLPLPELLSLIPQLPAAIKQDLKRLRYVSVFNLNLGVSRLAISDKHWIYFPGKDTCFFRTGFYHNFSRWNVPNGTSGLYAEVSYLPETRINQSGLERAMVRSLLKAGILRSPQEIIAKDTNKIKYGYVLFDKNRNQAVENITKFLKQKGIHCCGRYGSWKYFSMEDSILDGARVAGEVGR